MPPAAARTAASPSRRAGAPSPASEAGLERQADRAAEQVVLRRFAGVLPGLSALPGGTGIQRKCACGGTCDKCKHEEEETRLQRAPDGGAPAPPAPAAPDPANPAQTPATAVLVDDGQPVGPDQMARGVFMATLRSRLFAVCDEELAPLGKSAQGCPYLSQWLGYYEGRPASVIERSIQRYTGATAKKPQQLIEAVVARVRGAVRVWATTGAVSGIPGVGAVADAAASAVSAVGNLFRKSEAPGVPAPAHSPSAVQSQLAGGGGGLEPGVRSRMERGFGRSFAGVRIHTDQTAARLSRSLAARAFTVGSEVAFAPGQYRPGTLEGDLLIAHELAHTVQQSGARGDLVQSGGNDRLFEEDADRAAAGAVGAELGLAERSDPMRRTGLRLQGCSQEIVKVCPRNYLWKVQSVIGVGSAGCRCKWKCMPYSASYHPDPVNKSVQCPPDMNCDSGIKYVQLGDDYEKVGWGANLTPLGEQPYCGCFPLTKDGEQITNSPLLPSDIELTDVAMPVADIAAAAKAKMTSGTPAKSKVDPKTGTILPEETPATPAQKPGMTPPPEHVGSPSPGSPAPTPTPPTVKGKWPPDAPKGPKPGFDAPNAAEWRYDRYRYDQAKKGKGETDVLPFDVWKERHFDPAAEGGRPGRAGGTVQVEAKKTLEKEGVKIVENVELGGRYPDGVSPKKNAQGGADYYEVGKMLKSGMPESRERIKLADEIKALGPNDTVTFVDKEDTSQRITYRKGDSVETKTLPKKE